jgi:carbamoyl-phosphate synthase (ammonia)
LDEEGVPGIAGIDTRALTQKLRDGGVQRTKIILDGAEDIPFDDPMSRNLIAEVGTRDELWNEGGSHRILMVDTGLKNNMLRCLIQRNMEVRVVPWDYDFTKEKFDGLFVSNGPGDPSMADQTVQYLKEIIHKEVVPPIFGICMGNQLISRAAGAETFKMKFGNRGQNLPVVNSITQQCIITPQNHGYAVDPSTLPYEWRQLFYNANDGTNEGIVHTSKPIFTAQFHPEHCAGPDDAEHLFDIFVDMVKNNGKLNDMWFGANFPPPLIETRTMLPPIPEPITSIKKVLIVGSGGLSIGQAGEFDYSGNQAIKALKEENIEVVLMNPNIASVQSNIDKGTELQADIVYSLPCTAEFIEGVLAKEKPDGILISMGGQTALNTGVELADAGIFEKYNCKVLGTSIESIKWTEDRQLFSDKLNEIDEKIAVGYTATDIDTALKHAEVIGYPCMIRSAFALGGLGSGICHDPEHMKDMAAKALSVSPQILVERSMLGWKELEYEVVRDEYDNCVTVCNMENFDPLGVHTGDSIVIAPSQTLSNDEYHMLRRTAIKVVRHLGIVGECNIQYALHPTSMQYCIIEVNPRLSRSSALASKATGYPLAFVAAKLALGQPLPNLRNAVTKNTTACFEPSLDYLVTKIPRWDLGKFHQVSKEIGSAMKSVGEVMAIGRTFEETIQKALRMVDPAGIPGFEEGPCSTWSREEIEHELANPTDKRVFAIAKMLYSEEMDVEEIHERTAIDRWFLYKLQRIALMHKYLQDIDGIANVNELTMREAKKLGFADIQIGMRVGATELDVREHRKGLGVLPVTKQIDTQAAEYPANTNYLYMTYHGNKNDVEFQDKGTMVLGCGPYRIGSSVEFDWCAVAAVRALRKMGHKSIVVNYNPETVSTDYDECDRLYFEELSRERVLDIYEAEQASGVIVSVGGQIPQTLAIDLDECDVKILGTSAKMIDNAEDRDKFSAMLDDIGVDQPEWSALTTIQDAFEFCDKVSYPVLIRPSYVLSGAAMKVARNREELELFLGDAAAVSKDHPVVISKFLDGCAEIEMDGVGKDGLVICHAIAEHIENAGVHSGDATHVLPPQQLSSFHLQRCRSEGAKIVKALEITGPFNIQFLCKGADVKVIECNLRASRSIPFVSKTVGTDFINVATRAMMDEPQNDDDLPTLDKPCRPTKYVGVKVPMFSFTRLRGADPVLSVEMASTGEVACFGENLHEAYLKALLASRFRLPPPGGNILLSIPEMYRHEFIHSAYKLKEMGYNLYCTDDTHDFFADHGVENQLVNFDMPADGKLDPQMKYAVQELKEGRIDLCICLPKENTKDANRHTAISNYNVRRAAVDFDVPLLNNFVCTTLFVDSLEAHLANPMVAVEASSLFEHYKAENPHHKWVEGEFH